MDLQRERLFGWKVVQTKLAPAAEVEAYFKAVAAGEQRAGTLLSYLTARGVPPVELAQLAAEVGLGIAAQGAAPAAAPPAKEPAPAEARPIKRSTRATRVRLSGPAPVQRAPRPSRGMRSGGGIPTVAWLGAGALILVAFLGLLAMMPDGELTQAVAKARVELGSKKVSEAYATLMAQSGAEASAEGSALLREVEAASKANADELAGQIRAALSDGRIAAAKSAREDLSERCIMADAERVRREVARSFENALMRAKVNDALLAKDLLAASRAFQSLDEEDWDETSKDAYSKFQGISSLFIKADLQMAVELMASGDTAGSKRVMDRLEEFVKPYPALQKTLDESRRGLVAARTLAKELPRIEALIADGREVEALTWFCTKGEGLKGFGLGVELKLAAQIKFQVTLREKLEAGDVEGAWSYLAPLLPHSAAIEAARVDLGEVREAVKVARVARLKAAVAAGQSAEVEAILASLKELGIDAAERARIEASVGQSAALAKAREECEVIGRTRDKLSRAYESGDLALVASILSSSLGSARGDSWLVLQRQLLDQLRGHLDEAIKGLQDAARSQQKVKLELRKGGVVEGRLIAAEPGRGGLQVQVGSGKALHDVADLAWDEITRYARYASRNNSRHKLRVALLTYAREPKSGFAAIQEFRDDELVAALIAATLDEVKILGGELVAAPEDPALAPEEGGAPEPDRAEMLPNAPGGPEVLQAAELWRSGQCFKARELIEKAAKLYPGNAEMHGFFGHILFDFGEFDRALEQLEAAAARSSGWKPQLALARMQRDFLYGEDGEVLTATSALPRNEPMRFIMPRLVRPAGMASERSKDGHYQVYVDKTLEGRGALAWSAKMMDLISKAYSKVFPFDRDEQLVYRVYLFSNTPEYLTFCQSIGHDGAGAAGFFVPDTRILVVDADPRGDPVNDYGFSVDSIDTMFHEGFHQFIDLYLPDVPIWFNEGLAEYFGPSVLAGPGKLKIGHFVRSRPGGATRLETIKEAVNDNATIPFKAFFRQGPREFMGSAGLNYAQTWSVVHFLLHSDELGDQGRKLIKSYFKALREGKGEEGAYSATFGKVDLDQLEALWKVYVKTL